MTGTDTAQWNNGGRSLFTSPWARFLEGEFLGRLTFGSMGSDGLP